MKLFSGILLACSVTMVGGQEKPTEPIHAGSPVTIPRATQYDMTSKVNGQDYRIMVAVPVNYDARKAYPALYVLEANVYFATAADAMTRQSQFRNTTPALVIGVGYPSDDPAVTTTRRWADLTPTVSSNSDEKRKTGGGDEFLRVLNEEIKPFVAARFKIDASRQALWGHSIGGLMVLRALLRGTDSFSAYLISSPSIWWEEQVVLRDEAPFAAKMSKPGSPIRVLVVSAGDEQYRGDDAKLLADAAKFRMVDNASELAERLSKMGPRLTVSRYVLEGETHISVSHAALTRSLRFALPYVQQ